MNDYLKTFGLNGGVFATVTLTDIELILKIVLLVVTIAWTIKKIIYDDDEGKTKK